MKIYTCLEHVGLALDDIVDECEQAPFLDEVRAAGAEKEHCHYCEEDARYIVRSE